MTDEIKPYLSVHLIDGAYELFRQFYGARSSAEHAATHGVLRSTLALFDRGATHVGFASDHVIESFRNDLWDTYKTGDGMDEELKSQIPVMEYAHELMGIKVWATVELEADDAMASAASVAAADPRVKQVVLLTADKDLAQCVVSDRIVQLDRRTDVLVDYNGVVAKFGVPPESIPDYLALVGDSADGFPGLQGWGAKSASTVLAEYGHIESIPSDATQWKVKVRSAANLSATLQDNRDLAELFRTLATLRIDPSVLESVDDLQWRGPTPEFRTWCEAEGVPDIADRANRLWEKVLSQPA